MFRPRDLLNFVSFMLLILGFINLAYGIPQKKDTPSLEERVRQLMDMSKKSPMLRLNGEYFQKLVIASPRNYSFVIMLTALNPGRQCVICSQAHEEFSIVVNSWRYSQPFNNVLFFGMVDFDEGPDVFNLLGQKSAPIFLHFPVNGKPKARDQMDLRRIGFSAETISRWIAERTNVQIRISRPYNYSATFLFLICTVFTGLVLYMRDYKFVVLYNKNTWNLFALFIVIFMTSGQMWNHIRRPPFMHRTPQGVLTYIHGNSGGQFIFETYIILVLNAGYTLGMILLNEAASSKDDPKKRKIMSVVGLILVTVIYSLILSIFRSKANGYPYSFLLK